MDDYKYLCMGCMSMKPSDAERCPNCNHSELETNLPNQLKTRTVLNDRYIVGRAQYHNGESVLYIAYDTVKDEKVYIREFMPDTICSRKNNSSEISVNSNCLAQYKTLLSEFIQLNKDLVKLRTISQIQTVYELFPQNNTAYVVLKYVNGVSLNNYLRLHSGKLEWPKVKDLFTQVFTALNLAHAEGVIHKAISPDTIYVENDNSCVITDFCIGEVRTANTEVAAELFAGYSAPEQYSISEYQGPWTDVYSLAAVLYRCLTGVMPTEATTRAASDSLESPRVIDESIPKNVSRAIMNALAVSYDKRTQSINAFLTELFEQPAYTETDEYQIEKQKKEEDERLKAEKSNVSLALKVGLITFAALAVIGIILIIIFVPDRPSGSHGKTSITSATTTTTTTATTTDEETTEDTDTATSTGKQYVMPSFIGLEYIRINVDSYNMPITLEPEYVYTTEHKKGVIYEQSVKEGTVFSEDTAITVKVSKGSQHVQLPSYDGKNVSDYVAALNSLGIKYEVIYDESYPDVESGMIIFVRNSSGNRLDAGTTIDMEDPFTVYVVVSSYLEGSAAE